MSLPVWLAQLARAAPDVRVEQLSLHRAPDGVGRPSAVLIAFGETAHGPAVLLIERAASMRTHAGQAAFPGGATEPTDADASATALREAHEEVGLDPGSVEILASLPALYLPTSGFVVTPVLAWWARPHEVHARDPREVAQAVVVPIAELVDPANRFLVAHPSGFKGPGFAAGGLFVWGFTAGLLDRLLELGGWARDWDRTEVRPLPEQGHSASTGNVPP